MSVTINVAAATALRTAMTLTAANIAGDTAVVAENFQIPDKTTDMLISKRDAAIDFNC